MATIRATYDGRVLIPEKPLDLPAGRTVDVEIRPSNAAAEALESLPPDHPHRALLEIAANTPDDPDSPGDRAAQHDHYLYGLPKRYD